MLDEEIEFVLAKSIIGNQEKAKPEMSEEEKKKLSILETRKTYQYIHYVFAVFESAHACPLLQ